MYDLSHTCQNRFLSTHHMWDTKDRPGLEDISVDSLIPDFLSVQLFPAVFFPVTLPLVTLVAAIKYLWPPGCRWLDKESKKGKKNKTAYLIFSWAFLQIPALFFALFCFRRTHSKTPVCTWCVLYCDRDIDRPFPSLWYIPRLSSASQVSLIALLYVKVNSRLTTTLSWSDVFTFSISTKSLGEVII